MYFKRNLTSRLIAWKDSPDRKPLVLKGARQVGKTYLLKDLGKNFFEDTAYFNFEEQPDLKQFFEHTKDVGRILQNLSLVHGSSIKPGKTLVILDEIQECNQALNTLKYFCENAPEYHVASAGSLLGITLGKESSFPVGKVDFMDVHPLRFMEFLAGVDPSLAAFLENTDTFEPLPDLFFNHLVEKFKMYFISGGMPEPARILADTNDIARTEKSLKDILDAYALDFSKHAESKDIAKINYVWNSIPAQLGRENKKFLYQTVKTGARAREYEDALLWLIHAGLATKVNRCTTPRIPLSAYDDLSAFKLYLLDVGLLRQLAQLEPAVFISGNRLFVEFKGALTENYILQSLLSQFAVTPRYWTSEGKAEVDFLIQYQNDILPIEVKSEENIRSRSLSFYQEKFQPPLRIRYSLKNLSLDGGLLNIPLFMADRTKWLLEKALL
ncbi:MAG: ATP-binding protein [Lewinellaceae bacterium]|nr:ATP-binding protein [Lewinellaceae bacterium]